MPSLPRSSPARPQAGWPIPSRSPGYPPTHRWAARPGPGNSTGRCYSWPPTPPVTSPGRPSTWTAVGPAADRHGPFWRAAGPRKGGSADEDAETVSAGAGVRRGPGDPGVQVGAGRRAGGGGRAPFGERHDTGRYQAQAAEQGGDLSVAARDDAPGHGGVVGINGGADLAGGEVGGQVGNDHVGAGS